MTPIAFFAPLKSPNHETPSGDREIARGILAALRLGGFAPDLASDLRLLDLAGNPQVQRDLMQRAATKIPEIVARGRAAGWRAWVSYHNYYKAPDLIGPTVAEALGVPYLQIESTRARKRLSGPWAEFARAAEAAADAACSIFYFTKRDGEAVRAYAPPGQRDVHLRPFLNRLDLPAASDRTGPMLSVGMMRPGDKLESFRLISETLRHLAGDWRLDIAGDGSARAAVETLMEPFGEQVRFLGRCGREEIKTLYRHARLLFWPGVNEAIGLTYLEAQAAGIPVLAQDRPGLRDVLSPIAIAPPPARGATGLAEVLSDGTIFTAPAATLRAHVANHHLLGPAAQVLRTELNRVGVGT